MSYNKIQIKQGINFHMINTNKFKTNLFACFLNVPLKRENVTKTALLAAVLRRGTNNMQTQEIISKYLENMYGAGFDCGIEKNGDNQTIKFYLETLNDNFLPEKENLTEKAVNILMDIVFNPLIENNGFKEEYVNSEKENLKQIIEGKIDNKTSYALDRCIEEMYKGKSYGLYKYGYIEDLDKIDAKGLYDYYMELINNCKIDIFASGLLSEDIEKTIKENVKIIELNIRKGVINKEEKDLSNNEKVIIENMDITQGKLVIGLDIKSEIDNLNYIAMCYNAILGGGANSKMFQNVREKASLAYTANSNYLKRKQNIFIRAGIEIQNYDKALDIIKKQLQDMKDGIFSDEDIFNAKKLILSSIDNIEEEQDTEISYLYGQELSEISVTIEDYKNKIEAVSKKQIQDLANSISINTIYFLKN